MKKVVAFLAASAMMLTCGVMAFAAPFRVSAGVSGDFIGMFDNYRNSGSDGGDWSVHARNRFLGGGVDAFVDATYL
jgi:hypothetical protein